MFWIILSNISYFSKDKNREVLVTKLENLLHDEYQQTEGHSFGYSSFLLFGKSRVWFSVRLPVILTEVFVAFFSPSGQIME
jgi:hypothetical protein